jgi:hypothetical protein
LKTGTIFLFLLFLINNSFGQKNDRTYFSRNHNYSTTYSYDVTEITIHSDSTYSKRNWSMFGKKEWRKYKNYKPEIKNGKINCNGEFYILTEYRNGIETDYNWKVKITKKRLTYYYEIKNGKYKKGIKFKRI